MSGYVKSWFTEVFFFRILLENELTNFEGSWAIFKDTQDTVV